jgi:actin-related protein
LERGWRELAGGSSQVWIGGAVIADLMKNTESWWVTKQIWEENGPDKTKAHALFSA